MKKTLLILSLLTSYTVFSQSIAVNTTQYTVPQLVQEILFGDTGTSCLSGEISNITWSTGTNFGSTNGIGYFTNNNPNFPMSSGVILSTGSALQAPGPNTSTQSAGENWPGDTELFDYLNGLGFDPGATGYRNATVLEFDFMPYVNNISFDFLFASEEYGTFQCDFSDAFAFFLTDLAGVTPTQNIALIPNTSTPISVVTIRNNAYNGGCTSQSEAYFGNYNGGANTATAATNFNGETVLLNAHSAVIPLHYYHMKLVIADRNDDQYDSAVFLAGHSFDFGLGALQGTGVYAGLSELNDVCQNQEIVIQAGTTTVPYVTYSWLQDGVPLPAITTSNLTVTQSGVYTVTLTGTNGCQISSDTMVVQYVTPFPIANPVDMAEASNIYDLTSNELIILNGQDPNYYDVTFHHSLFDAQNLINPVTNPSAYSGFDGEIIYAAIEDMLAGCIETKSFLLNPVAPPSNDKCADAIPLSVGNSFDDFPINSTNIAATNSSFNETSFCDGFYTARDIWFSLTVPSSGNLTIETQGDNGLSDTVLEAFSSCSSNISIGCNNNGDDTSGKTTTTNLYSKLELTNLTPGQSIVLRAFGKAESQGTFVVSAYDTALSNQEINMPNLSYYPVPVTDILTISNHHSIKSVEVYNMLGQKVLTQSNNSNTEITQVDMTGLQSSVYLVKVISETNSATFRVTKN